MEKLELTRNAQTDQFSVVLSRGNDTIRCMVTVEAGRATSNEEKRRAALSKAAAQLFQRLRCLRRPSTRQSTTRDTKREQLPSGLVEIRVRSRHVRCS